MAVLVEKHRNHHHRQLAEDQLPHVNQLDDYPYLDYHPHLDKVIIAAQVVATKVIKNMVLMFNHWKWIP